MTFVYPAIFTYEDGGYWVAFPDLPGCFTQGDTAPEAIANAAEALSLHLAPDDLDPDFPAPSSIEDLTVPNQGFINYIPVDIDLSKSGKSVKKTLTIPGWLDSKAQQQGINFSKTLQEALLQKLY